MDLGKIDLEKVKKQFDAQQKWRDNRIKDIIKQCRESWLRIQQNK